MSRLVEGGVKVPGWRLVAPGGGRGPTGAQGTCRGPRWAWATTPPGVFWEAIRADVATLSADACHPSETGYARISDALVPAALAVLEAA
jgi:lysophospholipase L1-like esterase